MKEKVIFVTDPGADDALAILMALGASNHIDVLGLVCCFGNVPLSQTIKNAQGILALANRLSVPVIAGAAQPIDGRVSVADNAFGESGLGKAVLPQPAHARAPLQDATAWLAGTLNAHDTKTITLVCIAPLTNVAVFVQQQPMLAQRLKRVLVMGGCVRDLPAASGTRHGNITPEAEFNFNQDPVAASDALGLLQTLKIPAIVFPMDVTHQLLATEAVLARMRQRIAGPVGETIARLLWASEPLDRPKFGVPGAFIHDAVTIAWLLQPDWFICTPSLLAVRKTDGATVATAITSPLMVAQTIKQPGQVFDLAADCIAALF